MTVRSFINMGESLAKVGGVNVTINEDNELHISYCILKHEKEIVSLFKTGSGISSADELQRQLDQHLPKGSRLHFNFDGKGILSKAFNENEPVHDPHKLVSKLFPVVKAEDFVIQICKGAGKNFLNLARKDILNQWEGLFAQYSVVSVSLGCFVVSQVLPLINLSRLELKSYVVESKEGRVTEILSSENTSPSDITIGTHLVSADVLLAYASSISLLTHHKDWSIVNAEGFAQNQVRFSFFQNLYKVSRIALFGVIAILFLNAAASFMLQSSVSEINATLVFSSSNNESKGREQLKKKSLLTSYEKIGWKSNVLPLYYSDQLAVKVTSKIALTQLEVGVLNNELLKKDKQLSYQPAIIKVQGTASDPVALNEWIGVVEKLYWADEVYDEKYDHDKKLNKGVFEFYIRVR